MEVEGGRGEAAEREVGVRMGRGDGERGSKGEKAMKVVWRRKMEVERKGKESRRDRGKGEGRRG